ncbi:MAG: alpha/beta hydrolase, partial [Pseudomonadota bacterium]
MERVDPETRSETFDGLKIALSEAQKHVRAHDTNTQIVGAGSVFAAIKALCILMLAALVTSGCARVERDIVGLGDASLTEGQKTAGTTRRVFLATTRQRSDDPAEFFGGDRSQVMQLGYMDVHIPASHRPGRIERPKGTKPDPDKHFILSEPTLFETDKAFQDEIDTELLEKVREERDVLVFVHGYNTNFSAAVLRVAQFVHDTNYTGVPVLFSWASRGKTFDYLYDLNSALQSRDELERLGVLLTGVQAKHFDVVAHS